MSNLDLSQYKVASRMESWGDQQNVGVVILVKTNRELTELDERAIYPTVEKIHKAILTNTVLLDPELENKKKKLEDKFRKLFDAPVYIEQIPNEYCKDYCCLHLPWFMVTTSIGHFKIGWRKRVINIDWSKTKNTKTADELFPNENVTKIDRAIHAWSYEDAQKYIKIIQEKL